MIAPFVYDEILRFAHDETTSGYYQRSFHSVFLRNFVDEAAAFKLLDQ